MLTLRDNAQVVPRPAFDKLKEAFDAQGKLAVQNALERNRVYQERNCLLAALTKLIDAGTDHAGTAWLSHHPDDPSWDPEWLTIVFIDTPVTGQMSWHIHERELPAFAHLPWGPNNWDGHTTEQKYERLGKL